MERSLELWTSGMRCESNPAHQVAGALTTTNWTHCREGTRATYMIVADADHPWPGGNNGGAAVQGRTSTSLDATTAVWAFFESLP
jgi:polyhydroxybutyrate depolymerase